VAIKIISDSTSYIDVDTQKQLDIEIFPLTVHFPDESFKETEVDYNYFYKKIERTGIIPTSSQPTPGEIYKRFHSLAKQGHDIAAIFISSAMSGTYATALSVRDQVLQEIPEAKIEVFDSHTNCMALGLQVIAAARKARLGGSLESVIDAAEHVRERVHFYFVPETLEYLKKGGRMGTASALLGTILNIRPILTVDMKNGMTHLHEKARGTGAAIKRMLQIIEEDNKRSGLAEIIVHHINCPDKAQGIRDALQDRYGRPVRTCSIGPVIGLHTGLGTVGFVYCTENI